MLGFLWHFARQAKPLFIALFVVEFFVALTDAAVPWFMGRIVTFVSAIPPDRFLAETWPWLVGMLLVVVVARPAVALTRYLITNQAIAAQLFMSPKTVETHVGNMFAKLGLLPAAEDHRRVLAVLTYLRR